MKIQPFLQICSKLVICLISSALLQASIAADEVECDKLRISRLSMNDLSKVLRDKTSICALNNKSLRYVGETSEQLVACLYLSGDAHVQELIITSTGGSVTSAIWAAELISSQELEVTVRGFCASSCANYIATAATSLTVEPYSILSVHGGPSEPDEGALKEMLGKSGGLSGETLEEALRSNVSNLSVGYKIHRHFQMTHEINEDFYTFEATAQPVGDEQNNRLFIVSSALFERCSPNTKIGSYWRAQSATEEADLRNLFRYRSLVDLDDASGNVLCK